ncbi:MAG: glycosyl transferase, partial [Bacteroidetes bacterium HGW-Bacteroidetes-22]
MIIGIILLVLPALAYLTLLGWLTVVLKRGLSGMPPDRRGEPTVSVLVAARNEAARIGDLIGQLARQDYPRHLYEVVLADDHSTDQSVAEALKASAITGFSLKVCS